MTPKETKKKLLSNWNKRKENMAIDFFNYSNHISFWPKHKGEIYWCELGENVGSETNKCRPVLIVSSSNKNKRLSHVIVAPISSTVKLKKNHLKDPFHLLLKKSSYPFLANDSVVKLEQLRTVSKNRLKGAAMGCVDSNTIDIINRKIINFLDL